MNKNSISLLALCAIVMFFAACTQTTKSPSPNPGLKKQTRYQTEAGKNHNIAMKYILFTILFITSLSMSAQQKIYVHTHDGTVTEFLLADIDSMTFSPPLIHSSCPDKNHPHAIDLGLPSGTKWSCCNVGASSPEGYGGYYSWGETVEKPAYDDVSYTFYTGQDKNGDGTIDRNFAVIDIGSDIAATEYDAATKIMGQSWCMPTHEQHEELRLNCKRQWVQWKGVKGTIVIGPNDQRIFLPASGYRNGRIHYDLGAGSDYWSSMVYPSNSASAYTFNLSSGTWLWNYEFRNYGLSIRAVSIY